MKFLNNKVILAAASLLTLTGAALAQSAPTTGWYAGGSVGKANIKPDFDTTGFPASATQDKSSTGYKLILGYQLNANLAIEGQYQNLGKYTYNDPGVETYKLKDQGISVAAVGFLPLSSGFSLIGKAGVAVHQLKGDYVAGNATASESKTQSSLLLGFGAEYNLTPALALRAEYEYFGKPKIEDLKIKTDLLSVGVRYRF